jgi:hypothetical protein
MLIRAPSPTDTTLACLRGPHVRFVNRRPSPTATTPERSRRTARTRSAIPPARRPRMGHSLYLRHSHTSYSTRAIIAVTGHAVIPRRLRHSMVDAASGTRSRITIRRMRGLSDGIHAAPAVGACARWPVGCGSTIAWPLRSPNYRDQILSGLAPVTIVRASARWCTGLGEAFRHAGRRHIWYAGQGPEPAFLNRGGRTSKPGQHYNRARHAGPSLCSAAPSASDPGDASGYLKITRASGGN